MRPSVAFGLSVALVACAGAPPPAAERPEAAPAVTGSVPSAGGARPVASVVIAPAGQGMSIARSVVRSAVAAGLGAFLQHVEFDDQPVMVGGHFHGFRIAALHDAAFWKGVDLKVGDVVTGVNGFSIERPEQAQRVFDSLQIASELRVTYERDGKPRELVYAIVDDG